MKQKRDYGLIFSLGIIIDSINVISVINWDSLENELAREFEHQDEIIIFKEEETQSDTNN